MPSPKKTHRKKKVGNYPYFTVMFSITLSLFVVGLFALVFLHAHKLSRIIKENIEVNIILNSSISPAAIEAAKQIISTQPYLLKSNNNQPLKFISKEEAKKIFIKEYGEDFTKALADNPLYASFVIKVNPAFSDSSHLKTITQQLQQIDGVKEVYYREDIINKVNENIKTLSFIFIGFSLILILASVLLINNTIKLAFYSQRFLIRSMQLVGATKGFIQRPFLWHAVVQGFFSGILAVGFLCVLLYYAYSEIRELSMLKEYNSIIIVLGSLLILGIVIGFLSSYRAVNRYLKMSLDELY